jgi:hypothetical protein
MPDEDDLGLMVIGLREGEPTIHVGQEKRKDLLVALAGYVAAAFSKAVSQSDV